MKNAITFNKGSALPIILAIIGIILLGGAYYYSKTMKGDVASITNTQVATTTIESRVQPAVSNSQSSDLMIASDWNTYIDTRIGYSLKHPVTYKVSDNNVSINSLNIGDATLAQVYNPADNGGKEFNPSLAIGIIKQPYDVTGKIFTNIKEFAQYWMRDTSYNKDLLFVEVNVGGYQGVEVSGNVNSEIGGWTPFKLRYFLRGTDVYSISYYPPNYKYFEDILKTFTLTDPAVRLDSVLNSYNQPGGTWGQTITLKGKGFSGHDTIVRIRGNGVNAVLWGGMSTSDTSIQFVVPISKDVCPEYTGASGLPCSAYQKLLSGSYEITVENQNGTSAPVKFEIFRS